MTDTLLKKKPERLQSLDTLRGFDMFWIIGGGAIVGALAKATEWGWVMALEEQMHHVPWEGFHFEDLIFPLFMFISGVAIPYSLISKLEKGTERGLLFRKTFMRMVILVLLGLVYNGALEGSFENLRYPSVLSQIGIAYFFAAVIVIYSEKMLTRIAWLIGILATIAVAQLLIPVPGFGAGVLTQEGSINAWIDSTFLPGKLIFGTLDPEGILCIVSATSVTLMGVFAGFILRNAAKTQYQKIAYLLTAGSALILSALALSPVYPIIKNIWTTPFNMLAAGISFLVLALFYFIIDVQGWKKWTFFFKVIGLNSITIYLGARAVNFWETSNFLFGWLAHYTGIYGDIFIALGVVGLQWLALYYLYKNKIFLRV